MVPVIVATNPVPLRAASRRASGSGRLSSSLTGRGAASSLSESLERGHELSWKQGGFRSMKERASTSTKASESPVCSSAPAAQVAFSFPLSKISGFQVESSLPGNCGLPDVPPVKPGKLRGGLAMALSTHHEEELSPRAESLTNFFPEVDTTPLSEAQARYSVFNSSVVSNAYLLASRAYKDDDRLDGTNQLAHCMVVAEHMADLGLDADSVAAALLHEVLRHSDAFRAQMQEFMPKKVVQLVDRVTTMSKISQLYRHHRDVIGDERLQDMLVAMEDVKAVIIKLGCRLHNMRTISYLSEEKQRTFAQETLDIYSVVANRLGLWSLKAELEDVAFSVLHPEEFAKLKEEAASRQDPELLEETINTIKAGLDAEGIKYVDISGRPKNLYGIWKKMKADNMTNLSQVFDVTALRVVVTDKHDCYRAQRVVRNAYRCMPDRSKDFVRIIKKPNGYQSLHETVYGASDMPVEVQIRTHKMHYIAEYGFAAHWKYKENLSNEDTWLDKEVQYKKWLTAYKLGVHDKKVRPSGSPPTDGSLKSLGMHLIDTSPSTSGDALDASHDTSHQVDPFLRHQRFKLQQPARPSVSVVVQTMEGVMTRDLPCGTTTRELRRELSLTSLTGMVLIVNQRLPSHEDIPLESGDLVQVVPVSQALSRSPPEEREKMLEVFHLGGQNNVVPINAPGIQRVPSDLKVPSFTGFFPTQRSDSFAP